MYASFSKFVKELKKKKYQNLSRQSSSWVIDPNNILNVLMHNFKIAWPTRISMPLLSFLDNLL